MASTQELMGRLREETAGAHDRLERGLCLTPRTLTKARVGRLLQRFHGFYLAWEPWIEASPLDRGLFEPRRKSPLTAHDLKLLGLSGTDASSSLSMGHPTLWRALGSMYVVEGSTLGGQMINRWLQDVEWAPSEGLSYFASYGRDVGRMWRSFQQMLCQTVPVSAHDETVSAATLTFEQLHGCLCDRERMA